MAGGSTLEGRLSPSGTIPMRHPGHLIGHRRESRFLLEGAGVVFLVQVASLSWATLCVISTMVNASY